jgi:haloacetate dehalogenase
LDVIPTLEVWDKADSRLALAFWPFTLLAQPAPLPERLISAAPEAVVDNALCEWGSPPATFPAEVRTAYIDALRDPAHVHAICMEYRAAAGIDREHDAADLEVHRQIQCPLLALWSAHGGLAHWYEDSGGPLGVWRRWATEVHGEPVDAGHFFPEEVPTLTAALLSRFLR